MNNRKMPEVKLGRIVKFIVLIPYFITRFMFSLMSRIHKKLVKRLRFSITFKITSAYAVILTFILLLLSAGIIAGFAVYLGIEAEDRIFKDSSIILNLMEYDAKIPEKNIDELSMLENIDINIYDDKKNLIYTTLKDSASVVFYDESNSHVVSGSKGNYMIVPLKNKNELDLSSIQDIRDSYRFKLIFSNYMSFNSQSMEIQIVDSLNKEYVSFELLIVILLGVVVLLIFIILVIGSGASKRVLMPIDKMTRTVKNITINALDTRLNISGSQDELKDLAQTFNDMLDRIQESVEQQNQFVSDASHELRTPISVIQGYANLLARWGKDDKEVLEESITAIKTEAESMKELINKLLFLARGDKNTQKIEKESFYLNELIDEIVKETKMLDNLHHIVCSQNEPVMINADRKLIKEALRVFMDNSVKYTPADGEITINCCSERTQAVISIEDTGIGISKEDLPNIFNRFYRADKSRTKDTGGTGLGLAIAKWIVMKHKGVIEVQSKLNTGTKVTVFLPRE